MKGKSKNSETRARRDRGWRQVAKIVGVGLYSLPPFFANGLYRLTRGGLADSEIVRAFERCRAWFAKATKNGIGECECGCGTKCRVDTVNGQGQSVWCLDHHKGTKTFRGILYQLCNWSIGDGNRQRQWAHVNYIEAHQARLPETEIESPANEFLTNGAVSD